MLSPSRERKSTGAHLSPRIILRQWQPSGSSSQALGTELVHSAMDSPRGATCNKSLIIVGHANISSELFRLALGGLGIQQNTGSSVSQQLDVQLLTHITTIFPTEETRVYKPFSLLDLITKTRSSVCAEPKDRIYELLNLVDTGDGTRIISDYAKSTMEVYKDAVLHCLSNSALRLDVLHLCQIPDRERELSLPQIFQLPLNQKCSIQ